jgi:hypothetical protein
VICSTLCGILGEIYVLGVRVIRQKIALATDVSYCVIQSKETGIHFLPRFRIREACKC